MAIAYESSASDFVVDDNDTGLSVPKPTGLAAGDVLIGVGGTIDARTITPPAGWTELLNDTDGAYRVYVWSRVADSGDAGASTFDFTVGTFGRAAVALVRLSGATDAGVQVAESTGPNDPVGSCPDITPPAANSLVIWAMWHGQPGYTATVDRGVERLDATGADSTLYIATEAPLAASSQTGAVITKSGYAVPRMMSIGVAPSGGGGGGGGGSAVRPRRQTRNKTLSRM